MKRPCLVLGLALFPHGWGFYLNNLSLMTFSLCFSPVKLLKLFFPDVTCALPASESPGMGWEQQSQFPRHHPGASASDPLGWSLVSALWTRPQTHPYCCVSTQSTGWLRHGARGGVPGTRGHTKGKTGQSCRRSALSKALITPSSVTRGSAGSLGIVNDTTYTRT